MSTDKLPPAELRKQARTLENQGELKQAGELYLRAQYYREALRVFTQIGDHDGIAQVEAARRAYRSDFADRLGGILGSIVTTRESLRPGEKELSPSGPIRRTQIELPNGQSLVLLHKNTFMLPRGKCFRFRSLDELIQAADADGDIGFVLDEKGNIWCEGGSEGSPTFNCHAHAMRKFGINPKDWVEGMESPLTNHTNPLRNLLECHCEKVGGYKLTEANAVASDPKLQEDDVLVLVGPVSGSAARQVVHSVTIRKHKGKNWTLGKLGEGPLIVVPLSTLLREYQGMCDGIEVYREKKKQETED